MKLKDILSPSFKDFLKPSPPMVVVKTDSDFCREVVQKRFLTQQQMQHAALRYQLGKSRSGRTIFWLIDELGIVRDGRLGDTWVSGMLKARVPEFLRDWHAEHCLFGFHLISETSEAAAVAVIDAMGSAVILSELFPQMVWLAPASCFTVDLLAPLQGRQVILFPRTDATGSNYLFHLSLADTARRHYGLDITVNEVLEQYATADQKSRAIDLVGYLFEASDHQAANDPNSAFIQSEISLYPTRNQLLFQLNPLSV